MSVLVGVACWLLFVSLLATVVWEYTKSCLGKFRIKLKVSLPLWSATMFYPFSLFPSCLPPSLHPFPCPASITPLVLPLLPSLSFFSPSILYSSAPSLFSSHLLLSFSPSSPPFLPSPPSSPPLLPPQITRTPSETPPPSMCEGRRAYVPGDLVESPSSCSTKTSCTNWPASRRRRKQGTSCKCDRRDWTCRNRSVG